MLQIGKTAQHAIAVMVHLVECQRDKSDKVSSSLVATALGISRPLAAKILATLSQAGLVEGSTGPGGGYWLEREPATIFLKDVVDCFEVRHQALRCPLGEGWCESNATCPLHDKIKALEASVVSFLTDNNFSGFLKSRSE